MDRRRDVVLWGSGRLRSSGEPDGERVERLGLVDFQEILGRERYCGQLRYLEPSIG